MRSVDAILAGSLLMALILAGCFTGEQTPLEGEGVEEDQQGLGSVQGTVLTKDLEAVQGAAVRLVQESEPVKETKAGEDGKYRIANIEPGEYRIQVGAICCKEEARLVVIEADKETEASFQLDALSTRDLEAPYVDRFEWTGFIACAVGVAVNAVNPCFLDPSSDNTHAWHVKPGVRTVVGAMDWDPAGGIFGETFRLRIEGYNVDLDQPCSGNRDGGDCTYGAAEGQPPIFLHIDQETSTAPTDALAWDEVEEEYELMWRVFPSWDPNVAYQQEFTVYWEVHYFQDAPEGTDPRPDM